MICKDCGEKVTCPKHGDIDISEFQHDMDESWYYSCGKCVTEDGLGLGSIIHWCREAESIRNIEEADIKKALTCIMMSEKDKKVKG